MKASRPLTRRSFLKSALVAGAAPMVLRSSLFAADAAPGNQITLGFIGIGAQGFGLLNNCLSRNKFRVLAVCDVDTTRRNLGKQTVQDRYAKNTATADYKGCDTYGDFREMLARQDIDAVVIATPDHWHAGTAIAAANAGKDIYCEKPMAHTVLEGRTMVNATRANGRVFQVGSMQRSSGEFRAACELVRNGVLGKVAKVEARVSGPPVPCDLPAETEEPGLNWDMWLGPAPLRPYNSVLSPRGKCDHFPDWRHYREYGSGGIGDWGAHHFDIVQWALGYDDGGPVEFFAPEKPDANFGVRWRYDNGTEVTHLDGNGITFFGDKGKLYVNRGKFQLWLDGQLKAETMDSYTALLKELLPANAVRLYHSNDQVSDWLKCMQSRERPICDVEIGQRTATICNLVNQVYFNHKGCKWDPKTEQFTDGTGDASWLTREYRAPWKPA